MKIAIIGGGCAGMVGAIRLARQGADVCIYERGERLGRKLLATGNGQCNIDHLDAKVENYHGKSPQFVENALQKYPGEDLLAFWESIGLSCVVKDSGKVYPRSLQSSAVVDLLRLALAREQVREEVNCEIVRIQQTKQGFLLYNAEHKEYFAHKVLVTCGGSAASGVGGTDKGYHLLKDLGHKILSPLPALVQLKVKDAQKGMSGQKIYAKVTLLVQKKPIRSEEGELLFTDYGLSGVPILQLSTLASKALAQKQSVEVAVDLVPDMTTQELSRFLIERSKALGDVLLQDFLSGFLPKRIAQPYLKEALGLSLATPCAMVEPKLWGQLARLLKEKRYEIIDTNGLKNAQATLGGVCTDEFDSSTMESRLVKGLYAAGEVLDICGDCGGYNLHWATASASLAAESMLAESE